MVRLNLKALEPRPQRQTKSLIRREDNIYLFGFEYDIMKRKTNGKASRNSRG